MDENEIKRQKELQEFCRREVLICQSSLVNALLEVGFFEFDEIVNHYNEKEDEYVDIFEWWVVDGALLKNLEERGQPVLHTEHGDWWGRTCTGQAIYMDMVIGEIYDNLGK